MCRFSKYDAAVVGIRVAVCLFVCFCFCLLFIYLFIYLRSRWNGYNCIRRWSPSTCVALLCCPHGESRRSLCSIAAGVAELLMVRSGAVLSRVAINSISVLQAWAPLVLDFHCRAAQHWHCEV